MTSHSNLPSSSSPSSLRFIIITIVTALLTVSTTDAQSHWCSRTPQNVNSPQKSGDNGYRVVVVGVAGDYYEPGRVYTVVITGSFPRQYFRGFMLSAVTREAVDETNIIGTFQHQDPTVTHSTKACPHIITNVNTRLKQSVKLLWTAPLSKAGCVEFRATVIDSNGDWYKDGGALKRKLCEKPSLPMNDGPKGPMEPKECCACGSAKYEMTFEGLWSRDTHPKEFPIADALTHWSNIVGASHSSNFSIWKYDQLASMGVKEICETASPRTVEEEIRRKSREVRTIIKTKGIWFTFERTVLANRSARFTVDKRRHFVSMLTMLGPSPDWCVGLSSTDLCLPDCTWSEGAVMDLFPWDAGTDDGVSYMSPNKVSRPQQPIRNITNTWPNDANSPFYSMEPMKPLARLHLRRLGTTNPPQVGQMCEGEDTSETDFFGEGESSALDVEKKMMGAHGGKCEMTPWDDWSECSVTCGVGTRMRKRTYVHPAGNEGMCGLATLDRDNCLGIENECDPPPPIGPCSTTSWSLWSPCSVTCGSGTRERRRFYLNENDVTSCNHVNEQTEACNATLMDCTVVKKSHAICSLPSNTGPCRGSFQRWYYDAIRKKCTPFVYGGCRGNGNNFETMDECEISCADDDGDKSNNKEFCFLPSARGECGKNDEKWYFDTQMQKCLPFMYGGCGGNNNRFETMDECSNTCNMFSGGHGSSGNGHSNNLVMCNLPSVVGPCRDIQERWYFDTQMQKCLPFQYGGCDGNSNNFATMDECSSRCGGNHGGAIASSPGGGNSMYCNLPADVGPCRGVEERWYFDTQMQKCLPFQYGGCEGNPNNFNTMDECSASCGGIHGNQNAGGSSDSSNVMRCNLPADVGPCRSVEEKWYFDLQMQKCLPFQYGGCEGNANNFATMDECSYACGGDHNGQASAAQVVQTPNRFKEFCTLPSERGPCKGYIERWYFDVRMLKCLPFTYGGCAGNANNFESDEECMETCHDSHVEPRLREHLRLFNNHPNINIDNNNNNNNNQISYNRITNNNLHDNQHHRHHQLPSPPQQSRDCELSKWSEWSPCSATCGKSYKMKMRKILVHSSGNGRKCSNFLQRKQKCRTPACVNECIYGEWSQWSSCTKSCGSGSYRQRWQKPIGSHDQNDMYSMSDNQLAVKRHRYTRQATQYNMNVPLVVKYQIVERRNHQDHSEYHNRHHHHMNANHHMVNKMAKCFDRVQRVICDVPMCKRS